MTAIHSDRVDFQFSPQAAAHSDFENALDHSTNQNMPKARTVIPARSFSSLSSGRTLVADQASLSSPAIAAHAEGQANRAYKTPTKTKWTMGIVLGFVGALAIATGIGIANNNKS